MDTSGVARVSRYAFPPNSFALCGPNRQADLSWYAGSQETDRGTEEIIAQFRTLYPYLRLIAAENGIPNPFDDRVVEAYWVGNRLLAAVPAHEYIVHLDETLKLKRSLRRKEKEKLFDKVAHGALPHHAFHVLNVPTRTGHLTISATVAAMDACLINWGKVTEIYPDALFVETRPLVMQADTRAFGTTVHRKIRNQGRHDTIFRSIRVGDWVSFHWGYLCEKLTPESRRNLELYTNSALYFANITS